MEIVEEDAALTGIMQESYRSPGAPSAALGKGGSPPESAPLLQARRGRRSMFKAEDDLILLREVAAHKAHIAKYSAKDKQFDLAATAVKSKTAFSMNKSTAKNVQDHYVRLQRQFDTADLREQLMSVIGVR